MIAVFGCAEGGANNNVAGAGGVGWTTAQTGGSGGTSTTDVGSGAGAGSGGAPTVSTIDPADGAIVVSTNTTVSVTFSGVMDASTATTSTSSTCSGNLQISTDNFASCVPAAISTSDDTTFTLTPTSPLGSTRLYQLLATEDLASAGGAWLVPFTSAGFTTRYAHTILIDGTNDFDPANEIDSSTTSAKVLVSFDDTHLYLGLEHGDILVGGSGNKFVYFLLSTDPTLSTGMATSSDAKATFGTGGAQMMFHYKEQIDGGNYSEFRTASATNWDTDWGTTGKLVNKQTGYLEASIALSELGAGVTDIVLTTYTIDYDGQGGDGHLYNMLPAGIEGSGATPRDLVQYLRIQLPTSTAPSDASLLQTF